MALYAARIDALRGFYASDVYVSAESAEQAIERALQGVQAYVDEQSSEFGCLPGIVPTIDDEDWADALAAFFLRVEDEVRSKLREIPEQVMINVRI